MSHFEKYKTPDYIYGELDRFTSPDITGLLNGNNSPILHPFSAGLLSGFGMSAGELIMIDTKDESLSNMVTTLSHDMYAFGDRTGKDLVQGIRERTDSIEELRPVIRTICYDVMEYFGIESMKIPKVNDNEPSIMDFPAIWQNPDSSR